MLYLDKSREWSSLTMDGQVSLNLKSFRRQSVSRLSPEDDCWMGARIEEVSRTQVGIPFLDARVDGGCVEDQLPINGAIGADVGFTLNRLYGPSHRYDPHDLRMELDGCRVQVEGPMSFKGGQVIETLTDL
ncbi:MAG TPA: hypothetical protein VGH31_07755 [Acidimicrobiales bacterium]